jgi:flagellar secretion chaperone FliS
MAVKTANPMQLIVILYDAAITCLQEAREHIERKNIEGRVRSVNKSISIISELQSSLNLKAGGDIARSLDRLYDYMKMRIFEANSKQIAQPLSETESLLENLRSAWRELSEQAREGAIQSAPASYPAPGILGSAASAADTQAKPFNVSI